MRKTEEPLAVLDLSEDKQLVWLKEHREEFSIDNHPSSYPLEGFPRAARFFLADLAFRLRDEAEATCKGYGKDFRSFFMVIGFCIMAVPSILSLLLSLPLPSKRR